LAQGAQEERLEGSGMNSQHRPPKGKAYLALSSLNPQPGVGGRPRQHDTNADRQKAYRNRTKAAESVTKPISVESPMRGDVRLPSPIPPQPIEPTPRLRVHDCFEQFEFDAEHGRTFFKPKWERCDCSKHITADEAVAMVAAGSAEWLCKQRGSQLYEVHSAIVLKGGLARRQEREAAELYAVQHPNESNTDPKAWEAALKANGLAKSRGAVGSTGGMDTESLDRMVYKSLKRIVGKESKAKGASPNTERVTEDLPSPALLAKIEFAKTIHRLNKPTNTRRALSVEEIAHAMNTDVANVRQILLPSRSQGNEEDK
jgi:hypothetical protein